MERVVVTKSLAASSASNIAASQKPLAAGNLTLNGSAASGGIATLDTQRRVRLASDGNDSARKFTIYGGRQGGQPIQQTISGPNPTADTDLDFYTVTRIAVDGATAGNITVGSNGVGSTDWQMPNFNITPANIQIGAAVSGTVNASIEYTYDDFWTPPNGANVPTPVPTVWESQFAQNFTGSIDGKFTDAVPSGWRTTINSGTGSVTTTAIQAGTAN